MTKAFKYGQKSLCLKTFVAPFLPARLTAPGLPRMSKGALIGSEASLPWLPEVFLACAGNFRCWPKAVATSGEALLTITCRFDTSLLRRVVN